MPLGYSDYANAQPRLSRTAIGQFGLREWTGGWQPDKPESQVAPNEIPDLLNVEFTLGGAVRKRKGFTLQTDDLTGTIPADHLFAMPTNLLPGGAVDPAQIIIYITEADGSVWYQSSANLLASPNTDLVDSTKSLGAVLGQASNLNPMDEYGISAFIFDDVVYITSHRFGGDDAGVYTNSTEDGLSTGTTKPLKYDIATDTWSRADVPDLTLSGEQTGVPRAATSLATHDRVFYANVASQNVYDFGNRVYWSDAGTAETIDATTNYITVGFNDGTQIRKMIQLGSQIIILKERSVWALVGTDEDTFALYDLTQEYGTHSTNTCAIHKDKLIFLDPDAGVMTYNGVRFEELSRNIKDQLFSELNTAAVYKACGYVDSQEEKYYLSIPVGAVDVSEGDRPTVTYVYDFRIGTWTRWDYGFSMATQIFSTFHGTAPVATDGPIWTVNNDGTEGIFEINDGYSDNGTAYNSYFETAWLNPGEVGDAHRIRRLDVLSDVNSNTITTEAFRNFQNTTVYQSHTVDPSGATLDEYHDQDQEYDVNPDLWSWIKFKFSNNTENEQFQINGVTVNHSTRRSPRMVRGELNQ